jgi:hypothetical protein
LRFPETKEPCERTLAERVIFSVVGSPRSSRVGSQSMGCIRSSNELDGRNFHLRMIVQMIPAMAMLPPIATRMMIVLRVIGEVADAPAGEGTGDDSCAGVGDVTVTKVRLGLEEVGGAEAEDAGGRVDEAAEEEGVVEDERGVLVLVGAAAEVELALPIMEPTMDPRRPPVLEGSCNRKSLSYRVDVSKKWNHSPQS